MANYTSQQDENECDTLSSQTFSGDESGLEDDDDNDFFFDDGNKKARKKRHDAKTASRPVDKLLVRKSILSKDHDVKASEQTTPKAKKLKTIKLDDRTPIVRPAQSNHDSNENDQTSHRLSEMSTQIDRICEYTLVLMHCILYKINYYNRKTHFDKYIKYNIVVYKCKSEIVCEYVNNCVECMRLILYDMYTNESEPTSDGKQAASTDLKSFSIALAVLKSLDDEQQLASNETPNLLIKRYNLQIEKFLNIHNTAGNNDEQLDDNEWNFRESILKCLYSKDVQYPKNFRWQIQMKTTKSHIKSMNSKEDLFRLFAWRSCEREEITSIKAKSSSCKAENMDDLAKLVSIKPIKTITHIKNLRIQLFVEQSIQR